jgi:alpha-glucosidase (family GH31 glycosyl hydrolase)
VAPVLDSGVTEREVMLPHGSWVDGWSGKTLDGGTRHRLPAPFPGAPVLVRATNCELVNTVTAALRCIAPGTIKPEITTTTYQAGLDRDLSVTG